MTLESMRAMIESLTRALDSRGAAVPVATPAASPPPRDDGGIEKFTGGRGDLAVFLGKLQWLFDDHPDYFTNDARKVAYAVNRLGGVPAQTILTIRENAAEDPAVTTWAGLRAYLELNYGDLDAKVTARSKIYQLRQTGSAASYFALFRQYVATLGWADDAQLVSQAEHGLKDFIRDKIADEGRSFGKLAELMSYAIALDNRVWERHNEKKLEKEAEEALKKKLGIKDGAKKTVTVTSPATIAQNVSVSPARPVPARS